MSYYKLKLSAFAITLITVLSGCNPFGKNSIISILDSSSVSWDKTTFDYGVLNIGSSSVQKFTYKNNGDLEATDCSVVQLSDAVNFQIVTNNCNSQTMAASEKCDVYVAAQPAAEGSFGLQLSRSCKYNSKIRQSISDLTALTVSSSLYWVPLLKNYGDVIVNSNSLDNMFTLNSVGLMNVTNCSTAYLTNTTDFTITSDNCNTSDLSLNSSCNINVKANPKSVGLKSTTLVRSCNVGGTVSTQLEQIQVNGIVIDPCIGNLLNSPFAFGDGSAGNPYGICTEAQLNNIGSNAVYVSQNFILQNDLDLSAYTSNSFNLIATAGNSFTGVFNGNFKKISNLTYNLVSDYMGLFRRVGPTGLIKNLGVINFNINGGSFTGALVGENVGTIDTCYSTGNISGATRVGGLIGRFWKTDSTTVVKNSYSEAAVSGSDFIGGLIGWARGHISNSYHKIGLVNGSGDRVGGLIGSGDQATVISCYAEGTVTGRDIVGGLVGIIAPDISKSYFKGTIGCRNWCGGITSAFGMASSAGKISKSYAEVTLNTTGYAVGGITGYTFAGYDVENSYATASISSTGDGLSGLVGYALGNIINSYALPQSIGGVSAERGGLQGDPTIVMTITNSFWNKSLDVTIPNTAGSKTTSEMQDASLYINAGWDQSVWDIRQGFYPKLK